MYSIPNVWSIDASEMSEKSGTGDGEEKQSNTENTRLSVQIEPCAGEKGVLSN